MIAGLDPSGGAGMSADQRAVLSTGAWACPVCAAITVQSTAGLVSVHPIEPELVVAQAIEVLRNEKVRSIKTGALGSEQNVRATTQLLRSHRTLASVVDPVIVATRGVDGVRLLDSSAGKALAELLAEATVVTPNTDEASEILGMRIRDEGDLADAARQLCAMGPKAALVKGGHLRGPRAVDVLYVGGKVHRMASPRLKVGPFHGGGCTMASLVAGRLALSGERDERAIVDAVRRAKRRLATSIGAATRVGKGLLVLPLRGG